MDLMDSSLVQIKNNSEGAENLLFYSPDELSILKSRIYSNGFKIIKAENLNDSAVVFTLEKVSVNYSRHSSSFLIGEDSLKREILFNGNFRNIKPGVNDFSKEIVLSYSDVIPDAAKEKVENKSLSFTCAELPSSGIAEGLLEPLTVITVFILSVVLFFTVRSQ